MKNKQIYLGTALLMLLSVSCIDDLANRSAGLVSSIQDGYQAVDIYDFGMESIIDLSVVKAGLQDGEVKVDFTVDPTILDSLKNMDAITYGKCEVLPQDCYKLDATFTMNEGEKLTNGGTATLYQHQIAVKSPVGEMKYILPLRMSVHGLTANSDRNVVFYGITVRTAYVSTLFDSNPLTISSEAISLPISTNFSFNPWDLKVSINSVDDLAEFVEDYNVKNGVAYSVIPEGAVTELSSSVTIKKGSTTAYANIKFDKTKISTGDYLYPIYITGVTGGNDGAVIPDTKVGLLFLSRNDRVSRDGWKAVASSYDPGRAADYILDGNPTTFWLTDWSSHPNPPYDIDIDMKDVIHFDRIGMIPKSGEEATDLNIEVYASNKVIDDDSNPGAKIGEATLIGSIGTEQIFNVDVTDARYIRLHILNSKNNGNHDGFMAEFYVHDSNL